MSTVFQNLLLELCCLSVHSEVCSSSNEDYDSSIHTIGRATHSLSELDVLPEWKVPQEQIDFLVGMNLPVMATQDSESSSSASSSPASDTGHSELDQLFPESVTEKDSQGGFVCNHKHLKSNLLSPLAGGDLFRTCVDAKRSVRTVKRFAFFP